MTKVHDWYFNQTDILPVVEDLIVLACSKYMAEEVCHGAIHEMGPIVMGSLGKHYLDPDFVCSTLDMCSSPKFVPENFTEW